MGSGCPSCSYFISATGGIVIGSAAEPESLALPIAIKKPPADDFINALYNFAEKFNFSRRKYARVDIEKLQKEYGYTGENTHAAVSRWIIANFDFGE
jgi:hypothetical protein